MTASKPAQWQQSGLRLWWLALIILMLDQATKIWVAQALPLFGRIDVLPFFDIVHVRNYGAAFSFLSDQGGWQRWFFTIIAVVITSVLVYMLRRQPLEQRWLNLSFMLIVGGAIGNVVDRVRLGYVVDFLDVYVGSYHWPAFNVADSAIVIGAGLMIYDSFFGSGAKPEANKSSS
ncbi:lipoprotein signal peptidase [Aliidiomarina halalkaliphila]|uniref:Lipoprotein signal peptidase n=1 Tax=Aliidiomarina halalkaliphila TaxID=2593535 RepID=A0A552X5I6_9GAMM|nr:signal peptidase II [Aliidiomarina halalkaliphila]TRW50284.1 lipoprotein signal peptidase [Aliidiomarina halalkaliphila]